MDDFKKEIYRVKFAKMFPSLIDFFVFNTSHTGDNRTNLFLKFSTSEAVELYCHYSFLSKNSSDNDIISTIQARANSLFSRYDKISSNNFEFVKNQFLNKIFLDGKFSTGFGNYGLGFGTKDILTKFQGDTLEALRFINSTQNCAELQDIYHKKYFAKMDAIKDIKILRKTNSSKNGRRKKANLRRFKITVKSYDNLFVPYVLWP